MSAPDRANDAYGWIDRMAGDLLRDDADPATVDRVAALGSEIVQVSAKVFEKIAYRESPDGWLASEGIFRLGFFLSDSSKRRFCLAFKRRILLGLKKLDQACAGRATTLGLRAREARFSAGG